MQGAVFSISNVLIQSSINSFGSIAMAGNTAAGNIESFVYTSMNAMYQSALSFVSQNVGGGRQERIPKIAVRCLGVVFLVGLILGNGAYFIGRQLLGLYSSDPEVISYGLGRMQMICKLYFLCGMMDVTVGLLRGMGYSIMPMVMSLVGACGLRVVWIFTVFQWNHTLHTLYLSYPITWGITFLAQLTCFLIVWKRKKGVWAMVKRADA
jgi:Na+-driven multidrug efflux pump